MSKPIEGKGCVGPQHPAEITDMEWQTVPRTPTENMLIAARDWSYEKYGKPIGNDAAIGCYKAMLYAALPPPPKEK
jgi:hypothetical protein